MITNKRRNLRNFFYYTFPRSIVLISSYSNKGGNICTVAWHTPLSRNPPLYGIALHPGRYTTKLIRKNKDFAVNFLDVKYFKKIHYCGRNTGKNVDKFNIFNKKNSKIIKSPIIAESYFSLECKLKKTFSAGDHILLIGEVVHIKIKKNAFKNRIAKVRPTLFLGRDSFEKEYYSTIGKKFRIK